MGGTTGVSRQIGESSGFRNSDRPAWVERMEEEGYLQNAITVSAPVTLRLVFYVFGFAIIIGCLYLLVNDLVNVRGLLG